MMDERELDLIEECDKKLAEIDADIERTQHKHFLNTSYRCLRFAFATIKKLAVKLEK